MKITDYSTYVIIVHYNHSNLFFSKARLVKLEEFNLDILRSIVAKEYRDTEITVFHNGKCIFKRSMIDIHSLPMEDPKLIGYEYCARVVDEYFKDVLEDSPSR